VCANEKKLARCKSPNFASQYNFPTGRDNFPGARFLHKISRAKLDKITHSPFCSGGNFADQKEAKRISQLITACCHRARSKAGDNESYIIRKSSLISQIFIGGHHYCRIHRNANWHAQYEQQSNIIVIVKQNKVTFSFVQGYENYKNMLNS